MADTWNEEIKAVLDEIGVNVTGGIAGPGEVERLIGLKDPPTGQACLCKAHLTVWTTMREEMIGEDEPSKAARRAWLTKWLVKHDRVIQGIANCPGCEREAPATPARGGEGQDGPPRRRKRRAPPRRR